MSFISSLLIFDKFFRAWSKFLFSIFILTSQWYTSLIWDHFGYDLRISSKYDFDILFYFILYEETPL